MGANNVHLVVLESYWGRVKNISAEQEIFVIYDSFGLCKNSKIQCKQNFSCWARGIKSIVKGEVL